MRIIERYKYESDLQLEERINLMLMCDLAQELISQRRFNNETAACDYIMNYDDFKSVNIDKFFHVSVANESSSREEAVTLNISITLNRWKALYEARMAINEWVSDIDKRYLFNLYDQRELPIPKNCNLWVQDNDAYNQSIINERLIRHVVAKDILTRKTTK